MMSKFIAKNSTFLGKISSLGEISRIKLRLTITYSIYCFNLKYIDEINKPNYN